MDSSQSVYLPPICMVFWLFFYLSFYIVGVIRFPREWKSEDQNREDIFQLGGNFQWSPALSGPFPWDRLQKYLYIFLLFLLILSYDCNVQRSNHYLLNKFISDIMTISKSYGMYTTCLILSSFNKLKSWILES